MFFKRQIRQFRKDLQRNVKKENTNSNEIKSWIMECEKIKNNIDKLIPK
jgi:hypothetical protein